MLKQRQGMPLKEQGHEMDGLLKKAAGMGRGSYKDGEMNVSPMGQWMRPQEGADYLRISYRYVKRLMGERTIPSYPVAGNVTLLKRSDLDCWVEEHKREKA